MKKKVMFFRGQNKIKMKDIDFDHKPNAKDAFKRPLFTTAYFWEKQKEKTAQGSNRKLTYSDIIAISIMAITAALTNIFTKFLTFKRWSTLEPEDFMIYHPWSPYIYCIGSFLYIAALWLKGIRFWLAYFPAFLGLTYVILKLLLINQVIHPDDLANFLNIFPDWLAG